jgi:hypothetical protein
VIAGAHLVNLKQSPAFRGDPGTTTFLVSAHAGVAVNQERWDGDRRDDITKDFGSWPVQCRSSIGGVEVAHHRRYPAHDGLWCRGREQGQQPILERSVRPVQYLAQALLDTALNLLWRQVTRPIRAARAIRGHKYQCADRFGSLPRAALP